MPAREAGVARLPWGLRTGSGVTSSRLVGSIELRVPGGAVEKTCPLKLLFIFLQASGVCTLLWGLFPLFMTTTEAIQAQEMLMKL